MSSKRWKQVEAIFARAFGSQRTPLSGGNSKITRSDSMHPTLFLEVKQRANPAVMNLYEKTVELAKLEGKIPVLGIHRKGSRTWLLVCNLQDLKRIAAEYKGVEHARTNRLGKTCEGCEEQ
tara:strand:- start:98 stop:460 length:363 start_codon:yes stop_codon:yes gene_type:complete